MTLLIYRIQKHIFPVTLFAALITGASAAKFGSSLIRFIYLPEVMTVSAPQGKKKVQARSVKNIAEYSSLLTGNFIRNTPVNVVERSDEKVRDSSEIVLLGMIAGDRRWASALIQVQGQKELSEYYIGDTVGGYFILDIRANTILVEKGGKRLAIAVGEKSGEVAQDSERVQAAGSENVSKSSISRTQLTKLLSNEADLAKAKITPFMLRGKMVGLRMILIPTNHVFYSLGARSGDIIRRFNGEKLDSTEKLIQIYQSLRTLSNATIDIERSEKILTFEFVVTD